MTTKKKVVLRTFVLAADDKNNLIAAAGSMEAFHDMLLAAVEGFVPPAKLDPDLLKLDKREPLAPCTVFLSEATDTKILDFADCHDLNVKDALRYIILQRFPPSSLFEKNMKKLKKNPPRQFKL